MLFKIINPEVKLTVRGGSMGSVDRLVEAVPPVGDGVARKRVVTITNGSIQSRVEPVAQINGTEVPTM